MKGILIFLGCIALLTPACRNREQEKLDRFKAAADSLQARMNELLHNNSAGNSPDSLGVK